MSDSYIGDDNLPRAPGVAADDYVSTSYYLPPAHPFQRLLSQ